jgi:DNA-directed RNA polymerase I subunit RPA2
VERWIGGEDVALLTVPGVLRYMDKELASMAGKMKYTVAP